MRTPSSRIALLLLAALVLSTALRTTSDWDTFWHLRTGRTALTDASVLARDPFSFSAHGAAWGYKDLVADVVLYWGFDKLGFAWFAIVKGACAIAIAAALWSIARAPLVATSVAALLIIAIDYRIAERPLLFTLALAPVLFALLERARRKGGTLVAAVLVVWAWAQLHREALVGIVLLFGYAQERLVARWLSRTMIWARVPTMREMIAAQVAWVVAVIVCFANPSGAALYTTTFNVLGSRMLKQAIVEWQPLAPSLLAQMLPGCVALCVLGGLLAVGAIVRALRTRTPSSVEPFYLGCWIVFLERTLSSVRWLPYLAIVSAFIVLLVVDALVVGRSRPRGLGVLVALACVVLHVKTHRAPFGVGEEPNHYPAAALRFAKANGLHPRVVNAMPFGGYVMWHAWPDLLVLVDGRNDTVYAPDFMLACREAERDRAAFAKMRAVDGADWVLAGNGLQTESHAFLAHDPDWPLVFYSESSSIYVRRDAYPTLKPLEYIGLLAANTPPERVATEAKSRGDDGQLLDELDRVREAVPDEVAPYLWSARVFEALGPGYGVRRDAMIRRIANLRPDLVP